MKKRVFVGIKINEPLQKEILGWTKKYEKLPVRWLEGKNLHLTLIPPWYADENEIDKIGRAIGEVVKGVGPIEAEFNEVSYGPDPRRPRLIWVEGKAPRELVELKEKLTRELGQREENRAFLLHLTIARFRPETFSSFPIKQLNEKVGWRDTISSIVLFESLLSREGAEYEVLGEYKFSNDQS